MRLRFLLVLSVFTAAVVIPLQEAAGQVFVLPRRAYKAQVRRFDFKWKYIDIVPQTRLEGEDTQEPAEGDAPAGTPSPAAPPLPTPPSGTDAAPAGEGDGSQPMNGLRLRVPGLGGALRQQVPPLAPPTDVPQPTPTEPAPAVPDERAASGEAGGIRLYFYDREEDIAELAVPLIVDSYAYLAEKFEYAPTERFPYILYNTYQEFLETRLFQLQEGVLGVTSPIDLTLTLPYFGDHRRFAEVSTHELAHQFTIQKLRDLAEREDIDTPIMRMPLWFIEGLAEFYAQRGLDPEAEMLARDLVVNPAAERGYSLQNFFADFPGSVLWTYKIGQARIAYLEDVYGAGITQRILERSHLLTGKSRSGERRLDFERLLERVTGDDPQSLAFGFSDWLKRRAFKTYLTASQSPSTLEPIRRDLSREPILSLASSPDGNLLMYRRIDPNTGQTQLVLMDRRMPRRVVKVAGDGVPGAESLHPIAPRNFDLGNGALVYVAQTESRDIIYRQELEHSAQPRQQGRTAQRDPWWASPATRNRVAAQRRDIDSETDDERAWKVELSLGDKVSYDLGGLISADSPALSPDGERIAFVGTDEAGFRDLYVIEPRGERHQIRRLTNDTWAERQLSWGDGGIVFTSDGTSTRHFNLFRIDPDVEGSGPVRLVTEARDQFDPLSTPDGRTYFVAYQDGRADLHEIVDGRVVRRTDVATGLTDVGAGPDGGLWALWLYSGLRIPVRIAADELLSLEAAGTAAEGEVSTAKLDLAAAPPPMPEANVDDATRYSPFDAKNWRLGPLFGILGAGGGSVFGQLYASASDMMRDHVLVLNLNVYGQFELTDGILLYLNQADRVGFGTGLFQSLTWRIDRSVQDELIAANPFSTGEFLIFERFFGAMGLARFPLSSFRYIEASLALGGMAYYLDDPEREMLDYFGLLEEWRDGAGGTVFQSEARVAIGHDTIRYHPLTGPLSGTSLLLELSGVGQPQRDVLYGEVRLDVARYFALGGSSNFFVRAGAGTTYGGERARQFFLSSFDTLRGVTWGEEEYLLGRHFYFGTAELQLPLTSIVRVVFLPNIEAIAGLDFGSAADSFADLWPKRVLNGVLGVNLLFGPLVFRVHFAKPFDIGAEPESVGVLPLENEWVSNLSLTWLEF